ncbi:MAG: aldehyde dehydrogenase family protein [Methylomonas sp.]|jgi:acyl-CoA reductase-like NAD-dependent aldehyde dehydrogenase|uniref:aldehyde dehydrogenase family protein n=1 Tax=Methylomonas sp. TaxID=418 RepID=UPI0025E3929F|nr:aldehyde dehydrogenase family protein [Methylomonas sp.]MCK9608586.1 aldehyde dehydrogenase family protein [Methylomonas sp.]
MKFIRAVSPIDGALLGEFAVSSSESIRQQMQVARDAADSWAKVSVKSRAVILGKLTPLLLAELDSICYLIVKSTGKVRTEALLGELYPILDLARFYQKHADSILRRQGVVTSPFAFPGATASIERRPYGVVAIVSPWNYPFQLTMAPLLTALYAGNAAIFKTSELSLPISQLIADLFGQLDLPPNLVQSVVGEGAMGAELIDAGPDLLFFTGGLTTGRAVMQRAAQHPIPVLLELGGKDPMLVFADADLQRAADAALYGGFCNSGQACISVERLYVQQSCFDEFLAQLQQGVAKLQVGHGEHGDLGAMVSDRQFEIVKAHYDDAIAQGAQASGPLERAGNYVKPVLLWHVNHGMRVMREETFGPLLPVMAFDDEQQALQLANDSDLGLNASIWSNDITKAERLTARLQVGNWVINDVLKNVGHPGLPFGGVKKSGFGRYHGAEGLRQFSYPVSGLTSRSHLPKEPNWFPYSEQRYRHFTGYIDFVYGSGSLLQRIKRNWPALEAFKEYSAFDLSQRWQNLKLLLSWKRDY